MTRRTDLRFSRGDTLTLDVIVRKADGSAQDITGATLRFTAKNRIDDPDGSAVLSGSTGDGRISITDAPGGLATVSIPAALTAGFTSDRVLVWDLQITDASGTVRTLDSGRLYVDRDVTQAV